jgi:hypothetical protein
LITEDASAVIAVLRFVPMVRCIPKKRWAVS